MANRALADLLKLIMGTAGIPGKGWITHAQGVAKLIEHRGPQRHQNYPEKTIFLEARMMLVCPIPLPDPLRLFSDFYRSARTYTYARGPSWRSSNGKMDLGRMIHRLSHISIAYSMF